MKQRVLYLIHVYILQQSQEYRISVEYEMQDGFLLPALIYKDIKKKKNSDYQQLKLGREVMGM